MAKKIKFESFKYRFLIATQEVEFKSFDQSEIKWLDFVKELEFEYENASVSVIWKHPKSGRLVVQLDKSLFYCRGDNQKYVLHQLEEGLLRSEDPIKLKNSIYFKEIVSLVAKTAGFTEVYKNQTEHDRRIQSECDFHDAWASNEDFEKIDVRTSNEVCTAPEMRYIISRLGDIRGKRLLDLGCGLGEASVYFAMLGADVTSSDLSQGMLDVTTKLAHANRVTIKQHIASAEDLKLSADEKFDIIYAGNLLHHVNIKETITSIKKHLAKDGVFVSWDPLAYNPAINVYRSIANNVRTADEHPLKWSDIKVFKKNFRKVEVKYFWLTTLIIFVIMAFAQRRNPNKERFWKAIVQEGEKWAWLYRPLEFVDRFLLKFFPPLRLLCWNVVIVSKA